MATQASTASSSRDQTTHSYNVTNYRRATLYSAALFAVRCLAGLQAPVPIINYSPYDVVVNLDYAGDNCIYYAFDDDTTENYMEAYSNNDLTAGFGSDYTDLNNYLQAYKTRYGVPDLRTGLRANTGTYTLPCLAAEESVRFSFQAVEMQGSGDCLDSNSKWTFSTTVNGVTTVWQPHDPPTSNWVLHSWPEATPATVPDIDIGPGGQADWKQVLLDAVIGTLSLVAIASGFGVAALSGIYEGILVEGADGVVDIVSTGVRVGTNWPQVGIGGLIIGGGGTGAACVGTAYPSAVDQTPVNVNSGAPDVSEITSLTLYGLSDIYNTISEDQRGACLIGHNVIGNFDCDAAGTSIVIQANGLPVAVPLPAISRAWN